MSGVNTDWFIADKDDAKKIAAVAIDDASEFEAWPHLHLPLGEMELLALWSAIRGRQVSVSESIAADLLFQSQDGELFVINVEQAFLAAAAGLTSAQVNKVAVAWQKDETAERFTKEELAEFVEQIRSFADQATRARKPVLELSTL